MCIVAENTRKIINERGLKQKAVGLKAGYSASQFNNLLCGRKKIEPDDVIKISKALGVTPNDLYGFSA